MSRAQKTRIKTGDQVIVITGTDAGKKGKVLQVFPHEQRLVVEGVNSMTKNIRPRQHGDQGQRVQFNGPIHASNVMLIDPKENRPTRIGTMKVGDKKVRRAIVSQQALS